LYWTMKVRGKLQCEVKSLGPGEVGGGQQRAHEHTLDDRRERPRLGKVRGKDREFDRAVQGICRDLGVRVGKNATEGTSNVGSMIAGDVKGSGRRPGQRVRQRDC